ncbi:gamma-glutamyltransferase family protein [Rickettsiales bacterium]|nr:gamma-glutamyltransferase family protein [Rickettsiales bacterium]
MFKYIKYYILFFIFITCDRQTFSQDNFQYKLSPEISTSQKHFSQKRKIGESEIIVTANKYATNAGKDILSQGGNAADAAVTIQLILGLVEPQSSGIGGGGFAMYYDKKEKKILNYDGREKAPKKISERVFQKDNGKSKNFFDAVLGGNSVGVPGLVDMLHKIHSDHGTLPWKKLIEPAIILAENGFYPPNRLIKSLKREKYLWNIKQENDYFIKIKNNPKKKIQNKNYANTLRIIANDYRDFYQGKIARDIVNKVNLSNLNPGYLDLNDMKSYKSKKSNGICVELKKFNLCGPDLPSSGGIAIAQALLIYENHELLKKEIEFKKVLDILAFIYEERSLYMADPEFETINYDFLLDKKKLLKRFDNYLKNKKKIYSNAKTNFNSTTHFSVLDKFGNNISITSSIENSFGSRLFVNGFFLNNQLTDFSFQSEENGKINKNRVKGGKKPLSSMSPIILLDKNKDFMFSAGSPGGTAIIAYVLKTIIDVVYNDVKPEESIKKGNFIKKSNKIFLEKKRFDTKKLKKLIGPKDSIIEIPLTSGIAIIKKEKDYYIGVADYRRDGTVFAK